MIRVPEKQQILTSDCSISVLYTEAAPRGVIESTVFSFHRKRHVSESASGLQLY